MKKFLYAFSIFLVLMICGVIVNTQKIVAPPISQKGDISMQAPQFTQTETYSCAGGKVLTASFGDGVAEARLADGRVFTLEKKLEEESGIKFSNEGDQITLWVYEESAFLTENGASTHEACRASHI